MIGYILLGLGIIVFVLSFIIPVKSEDEKATEFSQEMIKDLVGREVESAKGQITDIVDETVNYAMEKTERSMDRITNEKMMAVNEYSETVLEEINKNHQEVVFLYDMLNDKHENLKNTVTEVEKTASEVKQAMKDAELSAIETSKHAKEAKEAAMEANANAAKAADLSASYAEEKTLDDFVPGLIGNAPVIEEPRETAKEEFVPEIPVPGGRISAIDRLKMAAVEEETVKDEPEETFEAPKEKPQRKKRTTKPKVREEAVVLGEDISGSRGLLNNGLDIVRSENAGDSFPSRNISEGPNLNLGENPVGKSGGRNNNERILDLHAQGKSNMAIAKELGLGLGEVKLVIDLFEGM
ncbi:MAG: hypothetical protein K6A38_00645 [Lachnospiraceae bacterium]|nr:hypothetical protein [Lachnospiraceae bacterium]